MRSFVAARSAFACGKVQHRKMTSVAAFIRKNCVDPSFPFKIRWWEIERRTRCGHEQSLSLPADREWIACGLTNDLSRARDPSSAAPLTRRSMHHTF